MNPDISVIIPTYTPKEYLWECLDCLEQQTLNKDSYEVLIVLNGTKEPYYSLIKERIKNYSYSIDLLYSNVNGVSRARNIGIEKAQGKYVSFIDDDDFISPCYLQALLKDVTPEGITEANVIAFNDSSKAETYHYLSTAYKSYKPEERHHIVKNRSFLSSSCCKLIPRSIMGSHRFKENITHGEDSFFMFQLSCKIKTVNIAASDAKYYVRVRNTSASRNAKMRRKKKKMELRLLVLYTRTYISHPLAYNGILYLTRIAATLKKLLTE